MKELSIEIADLANKKHANAVMELTDSYARDPMGINTPLSEATKKRLIHEMKAFPGTLCFLAFVNGQAAGIATCFYGFSTFKAAKVINIHDLAVKPDYRSMGVGVALLGAVEKKAEEEKCCKITLEVREDNRARNLYERYGFSCGEPTMFFMTKELNS